jgi:hypothetical protein
VQVAAGMHSFTGAIAAFTLRIVCLWHFFLRSRLTFICEEIFSYYEITFRIEMPNGAFITVVASRGRVLSVKPSLLCMDNPQLARSGNVR